MGTINSGSSVRQDWWRAFLGAVPDGGGDWTLGRSWAEREHQVPGELTQLRLHSFGLEFEALCFKPDVLTTDAVIIVPFYEVWSALDTAPPDGVKVPPRPRSRGHARRLAVGGARVIAVPWRFELMALADPTTAMAMELQERYSVAAVSHWRDSEVTPFGRSLGDLMLVLSALEDLGLASGLIGVFGHSLGAKLALGIAAVDQRVGAGIAHEAGLGFDHSNWSDPWYLGEALPGDRDLDDLLSAVAPRPFLWIAGGASDGEHNVGLVRKAAARWPAGGPDTMIHNQGHPLKPWVLEAARTWLYAQIHDDKS